MLNMFTRIQSKILGEYSPAVFVLNDLTQPCWEWTGARTTSPVIRYKGKLTSVVRVIIREHLKSELDRHILFVRECSGPHCVNPAHMSRQGSGKVPLALLPMPKFKPPGQLRKLELAMEVAGVRSLPEALGLFAHEWATADIVEAFNSVK